MMLHQGFRPLSTPVQLVPISPISLEMSLYLIEYEVKDASTAFKRDVVSALADTLDVPPSPATHAVELVGGGRRRVSAIFMDKNSVWRT